MFNKAAHGFADKTKIFQHTCKFSSEPDAYKCIFGNDDQHNLRIKYTNENWRCVFHDLLGSWLIHFRCETSSDRKWWQLPRSVMTRRVGIWERMCTLMAAKEVHTRAEWDCFFWRTDKKKFVCLYFSTKQPSDYRAWSGIGISVFAERHLKVNAVLNLWPYF